MLTIVTTRCIAAAVAVLVLGMAISACSSAKASTRETVAEEFASAYIAGDNDRAVELVCDGILDGTKPLGDSWAVSSAAPPANWDFSGLEYSMKEVTADGEVLGKLGKDVQFDVTTEQSGEKYCVTRLNLANASGYVKG